MARRIAKGRYHEGLRRRWQDVSIITLCAGFAMVGSALLMVFMVPDTKRDILLLLAVGYAMLCIFMDYMILIDIRNFKNRYTPRDYEMEKRRRQR